METDQQKIKKCRGQCFGFDCDDRGYQIAVKIKHDCPCILVSCPCCSKKDIQRYFDCHGGKCMDCNMSCPNKFGKCMELMNGKQYDNICLYCEGYTTDRSG